MMETVRGPNEKILHSDVGTFSITAECPNRLAVQANWEDVQLGLVCDGKTITNWIGPPVSPKSGSIGGQICIRRPKHHHRLPKSSRTD